ncbi:MAG: DNA topoisomerase IB [Opitutaceae bacterium]
MPASLPTAPAKRRVLSRHRGRLRVPKGAAALAPPPAALVAVREAGLRYVSDLLPGITRVGPERRPRYLDPAGKPVRDPATLARIRRLAIPPAWTHVWICPRADGHIQATGRDARGRKQYRYHPDWTAVRDSSKFERMAAFARALPRIRRRVARDLRRPRLDREKVLAAMVRLLETTLVRVGNEEYAKQNHSFGLTTLRNRHVRIGRGTLHFEFRGKSGKDHEIDLRDPRLAAIVRRLQELPGQELFQYLDAAGEPQKIDSADVNAYLRACAGEEFSAKDFRTWAGTLLAAELLRDIGPFGTKREAKANLRAAITRVAERLRNTPAVCRKCYIHPLVLERYLAGVRLPPTAPNATASDVGQGSGGLLAPALGATERAVLRLLRRRSERPLLERLSRSVVAARRRRR